VGFVEVAKRGRNGGEVGEGGMWTVHEERIVGRLLERRTNYASGMDTKALADLVIERFNEIAKADPLAIGALLETRVPCSKAMADHPTVQVHQKEGAATVGMLGIINGIVGVIEAGPRKGWGYVAVELDDDGKLIRFVRTDLAGDEHT
jgi:hypothetical protein